VGWLGEGHKLTAAGNLTLADAKELAGDVRAAPGFEQRLLAFAGLREAGPAAEEEVRAMVADPALRPSARLWLVEQGLEDAASLEPASARVPIPTPRSPRRPARPPSSSVPRDLGEASCCHSP
jgi:hypothetical protein